MLDLSVRTLWMASYQLMTPLKKCDGKKVWLRFSTKSNSNKLAKSTVTSGKNYFVKFITISYYF